MLALSGEWPVGGGEMTRRIRSYDWASTPLGPIERWPQSQRTAVDLMLASGHAMQLAWGAERIVLYNDAYAPMLGGFHPRALGLPFREAWPDIWTEIEPLVERVFAGETVRFENMPLVMRRHGHPEDTWWDFSYSPVRDESGAVAGLLNVTVDATPAVRACAAEAALRESEERQSFLLRLSDALRTEPDSGGMASRSLALLCNQLSLDRTFIARITGAENPVEIVAERRREDVVPMPAQLYPADFPKGFHKAAQGLLVVNDIRQKPDLTELDRRSLDAIALTGFIVAPLHRGAGGIVWALVGGSKTPRTWKASEAALMEQAAERIWAALERARAEAALRESEARLAADLSGMRRLYELSAQLASEPDLRARMEGMRLPTASSGPTAGASSW